MPIYEYRCTKCQHLIEVFAKMSDPPPAACEQCAGTSLEKVLHPVAVHYKGSGFYATDYGSSRKNKGSASSSDSGESGSGGSSSGSEGGSSSSGDSGSGSSGGSGDGSSSSSGSGSSSSSSE